MKNFYIPVKKVIVTGMILCVLFIIIFISILYTTLQLYK